MVQEGDDAPSHEMGAAWRHELQTMAATKATQTQKGTRAHTREAAVYWWGRGGRSRCRRERTCRIGRERCKSHDASRSKMTRHRKAAVGDGGAEER